ncbi:MAG: ABC transporter permease subunit [Eggerthellaceae bacterium]|nr:ABC transporter permease subunit [Eggerthellaceae bacterium]
MGATKGINLTRLALVLFFLVAAVLPLLGLLANLANPEAWEVFRSPQFIPACLNSAAIACISMLLSLAIALAVSWVFCRTNIRGKKLFAALMTLPMLIPSLGLGMGLIFLLGSNGILTNLLGLSTSIYGFWGIVMGAVLYAFPSAFLLVYDVLKNEDSSPYEAADVLGIPRLRQFTGITLPYLRKPLISAAFATFTLVVTDYGVPLMVGGKTITLPVLMYQEVIGLLNFNAGASIGFILLIPAVVAFLVDVLSQERGRLGFVRRERVIRANVRRDAAGYVVVGLVSLAILLPICVFALVAFVVKYPIDLSFTLGNIDRCLNLNVGAYWVNSLVIALAVALVGTTLAYLAGYVTARVGGRTARLLHLACIITLAVPGIVLGLAYVFSFKGTPLYGTIGILILVNIIHFFASPYLLAYNALGKLNENLEAVGATMGAGRWRVLRDVIIPQTSGTILEMFSFFFVNCMVTISAVAFLATTIDMPLALLITDFDAQRLTECAALVSLLILVTNIVFKVVFAGARRLLTRGIPA